ncbi:MAG: ABC transporter transmembrane domain-containing protein, partial [Planktothrix sp.]|uniref:ABC transporter transmembrane domain-containing protein n=1 Tax=Planktothrix sp. TaxID=3088171 RepID=UPI0038D4A881
MSKTTHPLQRLLRYARPYQKTIGLATLYSILNKIFDLAPPVLIGWAVDVVINPKTSFLVNWGIQGAFNQLLVLSILSLIIWSLESLFEYAYKILWRNLAQTLQHDLRLEAYGHLQELELAYFEERSSGSLMSILNDD